MMIAIVIWIVALTTVVFLLLGRLEDKLSRLGEQLAALEKRVRGVP